MTKKLQEKTYFWASIITNGLFYLTLILFFTTAIFDLDILGPFSVFIVGLLLPLFFSAMILYFAIRGLVFLRKAEEKKLVVSGLVINFVTIALLLVFVLLAITGMGHSR